MLSDDGDTVLAGSASTGAVALFKDTNGQHLMDYGIRIRIGDNAALGSWSLEAFKLLYQTLPGLGRRMP